MKWFYLHKHLGKQRVSNTFKEPFSLGSWTLLGGGGWEGSHIPLPTQAASSLARVPAVVWVSAHKDLWAGPDSEFIAHESLPVYRSAWKTYSRSAGIKWGPQGMWLMTQAG